MSIKIRAPEVRELKPRITVLGVGGAGGNAVNNMINAKLEGVEFVVANTDAQSLSQSLTDRRVQMGVKVTEGLGAGAKPDIGRAAAEESLEDMLEHLQGSHMVFIAAGMGGGTGTGAAPVIARAVRELGALTVGVVTKPFHFEGEKRMRIAEQGIEELQNYVDTLIIIPNQNLFRVANERTTFAQAFAMADEVLHSGVRGVTDLIVMPGQINLDFADIRTVMSEMGKAMMGTGEADGEGRALKAAEAAISNPLLDDVSMKGANAVLINITGGPDLMLFEADEAANRIRAEVAPDANIIFGSTCTASMEGRIRVSVVATGIEADAATVLPLERRSFAGAAGVSMPIRPAASPVHRQVEVIASKFGPRATAAAPEAPEPLPEEIEEHEPAEAFALGGDDAPPIDEMPAIAHGSRAPEPLTAASASAPQGDIKRRIVGIFGRRGRDARPADEAPRPVARAASRPAALAEAPTRATVQVIGRPPRDAKAQASAPAPAEEKRKRGDDLFGGVNEEDRFEIPAFLRRQAN